MEAMRDLFDNVFKTNSPKKQFLKAIFKMVINYFLK